MKKFLFLILTSFTVVTNAQTLVDTNKIWHVYDQPNFSPPPYDEFFKFNGDTTVTPYSYKKLYFSQDSLMANWLCVAALREDSTKKVYIVWASEASERLLYDFNLNVNDTFFICRGNYSTVVTLIDTVTLLNGEYRKRFWFTPGPEKWIDGIGSEMGVVADGGYYYCPTTDGGGIILNCFSENDTLKYEDTLYNFPCLIVTGDLEIEKNISMDMHPNPFSYHLTLHFSSLQTTPALLKIFNSMGEAVLEKEIKLEDQTLNLAALPQGIYLVSVLSEGKVYNQKIVK